MKVRTALSIVVAAIVTCNASATTGHRPPIDRPPADHHDPAPEPHGHPDPR